MGLDTTEHTHVKISKWICLDKKKKSKGTRGQLNLISVDGSPRVLSSFPKLGVKMNSLR